MTINLKPCPFCGSQAKIFITISGIAVRCHKCLNGTMFIVDHDVEPESALQKVVESWNRRCGEEEK